MKINSKYQINFKSAANPIAPFTLKTKRGKLSFAEVTKRDLRKDGFMENLALFFCKNFALSTEDPSWNTFKRLAGNDFYLGLRDLTHYYRSRIKLKDEDMTLLLARDKRNKIQGACLSYGCDVVPDAKDKVCYIDSIAVNPAYRQFQIGRVLVEKTLNSAKNKFTDAFLVGDRSALGFYEKLEFKPLEETDDVQCDIIDYLSGTRFDYPNYVEFLTKPLQEKAERWYDAIKGFITEK